jgi:hypothetical protein
LGNQAPEPQMLFTEIDDDNQRLVQEVHPPLGRNSSFLMQTKAL